MPDRQVMADDLRQAQGTQFRLRRNWEAAAGAEPGLTDDKVNDSSQLILCLTGSINAVVYSLHSIANKEF